MDRLDVALHAAEDSLEIMFQLIKLEKYTQAENFAYQTMQFISEARLILHEERETI